MKLPPYFIGLALLFWGYTTGYLVAGIILAVILESHQFIRKRWKFSLDDLIKIADLNSIILLAVVSFVVLTHDIQPALTIVMTLLPMVFLPIIAAQVYHTEEKIIIATKLGQKKKPAFSHKPMNFRYVYLGIVLLSTASVSLAEGYFIYSLFGFVIWGLYQNRNRSQRPILFIFSAVLVLSLTVLIKRDVDRTLDWMKSGFSGLLDQNAKQSFNPFKYSTAIGTLEEIKQSGKIRLRIDSSVPPPFYLKAASYDSYAAGNWLNSRSRFSPFQATKHNTWRLGQETTGELTDNIVIEMAMNGSLSVLPVPYGLKSLSGDEILQLQKNPSGVLQAKTDTGLLIYRCDYMEKPAPHHGEPTPTELKLPENEKGWIHRTLLKLKDASQSPEKAVLALKTMFNRHFRYALSIRRPQGNPDLKSFMLQIKSGHCEYFASATALLLRGINIPTRYVTGYVVDEKSPFGSQYLVRARHAHAWVEARIEGKWKIIDTTPSEWLQRHSGSGSDPILERIGDLISYIKNRIRRFFKGDKSRRNRFLFIALFALILTLVIKVAIRLKKNPPSNRESSSPVIHEPYSEFSEIVKRLKKYGIAVKRGESYLQWFKRIDGLSPETKSELIRLYRIHLKKRFDPNGLTESENRQFRQQILAWLRQER